MVCIKFQLNLWQNMNEELQGSIWDFLFGGKSILKKIFEPRGGEKKFFRPSLDGFFFSETFLEGGSTNLTAHCK